MANTTQSLWPEKIGTSSLPEPVRILQEQGRALSGLTDGALYGEVLQSNFPSSITVTYDFHVGVADKPYRHKLFSIEVPIRFDYPVMILDYETLSKIMAGNEDEFMNEIRLLLNSHTTQGLLSRLLEFAKH